MEIVDVLSSDNVKKYVFAGDNAVVEAVIYKYPDYKTRSTICISTQSGCKVGCSFCGTGDKFVRNLEASEITDQVIKVFDSEGFTDIINSDKLQIMFMSMGEPSHNWDNLKKAMRSLHFVFPKAELLVSTIGTDNDNFIKEFISLSKEIPTVGLQFSVHHFDDDKRNRIIPFEDKLSLEEIADFGRKWHKATGRTPFCNYVVTNANNKGYERLYDLFEPEVFQFTFSVLCSKSETIKSAFRNNKDNVLEIHNAFLEKGYSVRVFDPAGQDDIGGGCGQLWQFQKFIRGEKVYGNK